jgi:hypothetical protein
MRHLLTAVAALGFFPLCHAPASAQDSETDRMTELSECIVGNSTGNDRVLVARWVGVSLASAPQLVGVVTVDQAEREQVDRQMAALFTRLITVDCLAQSRSLLADGQADALGSAFRQLGFVAIQELTANPGASAAMESFAGYLEEDAFSALQQASDPAP